MFPQKLVADVGFSKSSPIDSPIVVHYFYMGWISVAIFSFIDEVTARFGGQAKHAVLLG